MSDTENPFSKNYSRRAILRVGALGAAAGVAAVVADRAEAPNPPPTHEKSEDEKKVERLRDDILAAGVKGQVSVFRVADETMVRWSSADSGGIRALPKIGDNKSAQYHLGDQKGESTVKFKDANIYKIQIVNGEGEDREEQWWLYLYPKSDGPITEEFVGSGESKTLTAAYHNFALLRSVKGENETKEGETFGDTVIAATQSSSDRAMSPTEYQKEFQFKPGERIY